MDWEQARDNRIAKDQAEALVRVEKKISEAIHSTQNRKELEAVVTKNFQEARAESISTPTDIQKGIRNLSTRRPRRPTAEDYFKENEEPAALRKETGRDLDALLAAQHVLL